MSHYECNHCRTPMTDANRRGWLAVAVHFICEEDAELAEEGPGMPMALVCPRCMPTLGEFLCPEIKEIPAWISGKDQLEAILRDRGE